MAFETRHEEFVKDLCHHLVSLACVHEPTSPNDKFGTTKFFTSGFIMEIRGLWLFVTAGHVFEQINEQLRKHPTRYYRFMMADSFGLTAKFPEPFHVDYINAPKHYLYDEEGGYDFGLLLLNQNQIRLLKKNDIVPLNEGNWQHQEGVDFFFYCMLGFPEQEMILDKPDYAQIKPIFISLERLQEAPERFAKHTIPMFYARIPKPSDRLNIEGMSGCPIFGFTRNEAGSVSYFFVAIQSEWLPDSKIISVCQMPFLGKLLRTAVDGLAAEQAAIQAATP
jgi:hypothetical protein